MFKLLKKYFTISKLERRTLIQIFFWLIFSFILVRLVPLRWFSHLLGEFNNEQHDELNEYKLDIIRLIKKNIRRCKRVLPWKVKCFEEAIAAKKVMEKQKIQTTLYLGVDKNKENNLEAHAWLKAGDMVITGKQGYDKFTVVGFYS